MAADLTSLPPTSLPRALNRCGVPVVNPLLDAITDFAASQTAEVGAKTILPALLAGPGVGPGLLKNMGISKHLHLGGCVLVLTGPCTIRDKGTMN